MSVDLRRRGRPETRRIRREKRTIGVMIDMFCRDRHHGGSQEAVAGGRCGECEALRAYAMQRIDRCPFWYRKPTCANCTVHCYREEMRETVREVMRYAGRRMPREHPWLAILHVIDGYRAAPDLSKERRSR